MYIYILRDFIYLFLDREEGREKERERETSMFLSYMPLPGHLACNPGMCPDWQWNQQPFGLQADAQSTGPHQPGRERFILESMNPFLPFPQGWRQPACTALGVSPLENLVPLAREPRHWISLPLLVNLHGSLWTHVHAWCAGHVHTCVHIGVYKYTPRVHGWATLLAVSESGTSGLHTLFSLAAAMLPNVSGG